MYLEIYRGKKCVPCPTFGGGGGGGGIVGSTADRDCGGAALRSSEVLLRIVHVLERSPHFS